MKNCICILLALVSIHLFVPKVYGQSTWYIAPSGNDQNNGGISSPFKSIERALTQIRESGADKATDFRIILRGGTYEIRKPIIVNSALKLHPESTLNIEGYRGENPLLSGNKKTTGKWQKAGVNLWKIQVEDSFNQLFINGERATRGRYPNEGKWLEADSVQLTSNRLVFTNKLPVKFETISTAELHITGVWHYIRQSIQKFDSNTQAVITNQYPGPECSSTKINTRDRAHFENALLFVDVEKEWFLDKTAQELFLFSKSDPNHLTIEYPVVDQIMKIEGTRTSPLNGIYLKGITMTGTQWEMGEVERKGIQGGIWGTTKGKAVYAPSGALMLEWVSNSQISNCTFQSLGEGAITLGLGCFQNQIADNTFEDIGSNVIQIGYRDSYIGEGHPLHKDFTDPVEVSHHNLIRNNHLKNFATTDKGAVGIWVGYSHNNQIDHNLIEDFPYTGISVGWYWSDESNMVKTNCHSNIIEWNEVRDGMKYLSDGSGIYLVGNQPGTKINDNWVYNIGGGYMQANGIYIDEGGANMVMARNYIHDLRNTDKSTSSVHLHKNNIASMSIYDNGEDHILKIIPNPNYIQSKRINVSPIKPVNTSWYGLLPKNPLKKK